MHIHTHFSFQFSKKSSQFLCDTMLRIPLLDFLNNLERCLYTVYVLHEENSLQNSMCEITKLYKKSVNILLAYTEKICKLAVGQVENTRQELTLKDSGETQSVWQVYPGPHLLLKVDQAPGALVVE